MSAARRTATPSNPPGASISRCRSVAWSSEGLGPISSASKSSTPRRHAFQLGHERVHVQGPSPCAARPKRPQLLRLHRRFRRRRAAHARRATDAQALDQARLIVCAHPAEPAREARFHLRASNLGSSRSTCCTPSTPRRSATGSRFRNGQQALAGPWLTTLKESSKCACCCARHGRGQDRSRQDALLQLDDGLEARNRSRTSCPPTAS